MRTRQQKKTDIIARPLITYRGDFFIPTVFVQAMLWYEAHGPFSTFRFHTHIRQDSPGTDKRSGCLHEESTGQEAISSIGCEVEEQWNPGIKNNRESQIKSESETGLPPYPRIKIAAWWATMMGLSTMNCRRLGQRRSPVLPILALCTLSMLIRSAAKYATATQMNERVLGRLHRMTSSELWQALLNRSGITRCFCNTFNVYVIIFT